MQLRALERELDAIPGRVCRMLAEADQLDLRSDWHADDAARACVEQLHSTKNFTARGASGCIWLSVVVPSGFKQGELADNQTSVTDNCDTMRRDCQ